MWRSFRVVFGLCALVAAAQAMADKFEPTISVTVADPATPIFHGKTNLPDGTGINVAVNPPGCRMEELSCVLLGQSKATVEHGEFHTERFWTQVPISQRIYTIEVLLVVPSMQPENVKKVIGEDGENMVGPLVEAFEASSLGKGGQRARYSTSAQLGDPRVAERDDPFAFEYCSALRIKELFLKTKDGGMIRQLCAMRALASSERNKAAVEAAVISRTGQADDERRAAMPHHDPGAVSLCQPPHKMTERDGCQ
jgi:hypothetical protein